MEILSKRQEQNIIEDIIIDFVRPNAGANILEIILKKARLGRVEKSKSEKFKGSNPDIVNGVRQSLNATIIFARNAVSTV